MLINGEEVKIDDLIGNVDFEANMRQPVNDSLDLTAYQIEVLKRYQIDYNVTSLKDLIYLISQALEENNDEELEFIASEITQRDYYENTNK